MHNMENAKDPGGAKEEEEGKSFLHSKEAEGLVACLVGDEVRLILGEEKYLKDNRLWKTALAN